MPDAPPAHTAPADAAPTRTVTVAGRSLRVVDLPAVLGARLPRLPLVMRLLVENHLRATGGRDLAALSAALDRWLAGTPARFEFTFLPNRLLMHDTTCTPALADIAAMRDALAQRGGDPRALEPVLPVEVSVDHSLSVDHFAVADALSRNRANEIARNAERYRFMKWASVAMERLNVNPPGTGIMHTINLEQLATVVEITADGLAHPDMLLGTDSHTPMVNGIGVLGWGVGGLEAESVMFGEATTLAVPEVVGVRLLGRLPHGVLSTDLALVVTHELRKLGVSGAMVEFFGPGVATLSADDRAVVANMAPEYGSTTGYFPVDRRTVDYLRRTARPPDLTDAIEPLMRAAGLWFDPHGCPHYDRAIEVDLGALVPSLAGPRRPQDLVAPAGAKAAVEATLGRPLGRPLGNGAASAAPDRMPSALPDGAVGIAAITSCTNTSDPRLLVIAGLLARKARALGLTPAPWVKTSLAPGSPSAQRYLARAGLLDDLDALGFGIVGFGCTTCIGNSGPLPAPVAAAVAGGTSVVAVLSGNRNFPGRVHPQLDLGFLASPPLVVAYALRGDVRGDILSEPLGDGASGDPVHLADLWPSDAEVEAALALGFAPADVPAAFAAAARNEAWAALEAPETPLFPWDPGSRYLRPPKFATPDAPCRLGRYEAAPLLVLGDDMTTDHISPAGRIDADSEAGRWLVERGADPADLNVFAAYRGNWEVMLRGLFTNRLAVNALDPSLPAGSTRLEDGTALPLHGAALAWEARGQATVILAGERYGMGSSRDWAAKGAALLGVRAVVARSFERIHRTNLIGMGILPIAIKDDFVPARAALTPAHRICVRADADALAVGQPLTLTVRRGPDALRTVAAVADVATEAEIATLRAGGIFRQILTRAGIARDATTQKGHPT